MVKEFQTSNNIFLLNHESIGNPIEREVLNTYKKFGKKSSSITHAALPDDRLLPKLVRPYLAGLRLQNQLQPEPCQKVHFAPAPGLELPLEPLAASTREEEPQNMAPSGPASRPRPLVPLYPCLHPQERRGVVDGDGEAVLGAEAADDEARCDCGRRVETAGNEGCEA